MSRTPYTANITTTLGIDIDALMVLAQTPGNDNPIGTCAMAIATTIWDMESAERSANEAMTALTSNTAQQVANLAGEGKARFDVSWLTHHAAQAAEASAKLTAGVEKIRTFKRLLDMLVAQAANA